MPKISVLLPVYNNKEFLSIAIDSILKQTYRDFELLIINDGSTENIDTIIETYNDKRIKYISRSNKGLGATLNELLNMSSGHYIARMDSDDYSLPSRLQSQLYFLDSNKDIVMTGGQIKFLVNNNTVNHFTMPLDNDTIKKYLLEARFPICHPATMFRSDIAHNIGGYKTQGSGEDLDFFLKMSESGKLANINETILYYRITQSSLSIRNRNELNMNYSLALHNHKMRLTGQPEISEDFFKMNFWHKQPAHVKLLLYFSNLSEFFYRNYIIYKANKNILRSYIYLSLAAALRPKTTLKRLYSITH